MFRTATLACCLVVTLTAVVRADVPLPPHVKYVKPWLRFEGIEDYPDHVFFLRFLTFSGGPSGAPHTLIEIKNSESFDPHFQRRLSDVSLLVMERREFEKRASQDSSLKWLHEPTNGVNRTPLEHPEATAWFFDESGPVTTYRVILNGGQPIVETFHPIGGTIRLCLGIAAAIALVVLGMWLYRRRKTAEARLV